jgi:4'-phosphopantetheinyl transferase
MIVDVYQFRFPAIHIQEQAAKKMLSYDERLRFARMIEPWRSRSIMARSLLRFLLGARLGITPQDVSFVYGLHGKPALSADANRNIHFNLAHSEDLAVIAIGQGAPIGIDLEAMLGVQPHDMADPHIFSSRELFVFEELPLDQRGIVFFRTWAFKEAFVKATGEGLTRSLASFEIEFCSENTARIEKIPLEWASIPWTLVSFDTFPGFIGALVVGNHQVIVRRCNTSVLLPILEKKLETMYE